LRAAAVGGGAYVAGRRRAQRQAAEEQAYADQDARISQLEQQQGAPAAPAPAPDRQPSTAAAPAAPSLSDQLSDIKRLHDQGILSDEEFSAAKAKVLGI
jgi:hypothetical protein